jgi:transposase
MRWTRRGVWDTTLVALRQRARLAEGREAAPTGAVVDSSSVKASPVPGDRGFDGAKKIDGIKRHILTDTTGLLLAVEVTAANEQDRAVLRRLLAAAKTNCPNIAPPPENSPSRRASTSRSSAARSRHRAPGSSFNPAAG